MSESPKAAPRRVTPRGWARLTVAGAAMGAAVAGSAGAAQIAGALTGGPERLWLAQSEGGEGGESGAVAEASPEVAYLGRLSLVEGHIRAAVMLYAKGLTDDAVGLSGHPEAEMMDEVRAGLAERGKADFTPELEQVGSLMAEGAGLADVEAAMAALAAAIAEARQVEGITAHDRMQAIVALTRAAAVEYQGSIEGGTVSDVLAYHEARGFLDVAQEETASLAIDADPKVDEIAARVAEALAETAPAFGDIAAAEPFAGDSGILFAAAAKAELLSYRLR